MAASKPISHMTWDDTYNMAIKTAKTPQEAEAIRAGFQKGMAEIIAHPTAGQRK